MHVLKRDNTKSNEPLLKDTATFYVGPTGKHLQMSEGGTSVPKTRDPDMATVPVYV